MEAPDVSVTGHQDRTRRSGRVVLEPAGVHPSLSLIESACPGVLRDDRQPGKVVASLADLGLGRGQQSCGYADATVAAGYVKLVDFVSVHHDKADDIAGHLGDSRVGHPVDRPCGERVAGPDPGEGVRNSVDVRFSPSGMPDSSNARHVGVVC